jgi:hypothetical protein
LKEDKLQILMSNQCAFQISKDGKRNSAIHC